MTRFRNLTTTMGVTAHLTSWDPSYRSPHDASSPGRGPFCQTVSTVLPAATISPMHVFLVFVTIKPFFSYLVLELWWLDYNHKQWGYPAPFQAILPALWSTPRSQSSWFFGRGKPEAQTTKSGAPDWGVHHKVCHSTSILQTDNHNNNL